MNFNNFKSTTIRGAFRNSDYADGEVLCDGIFDRNLSVMNDLILGSTNDITDISTGLIIGYDNSGGSIIIIKDGSNNIITRDNLLQLQNELITSEDFDEAIIEVNNIIETNNVTLNNAINTNVATLNDSINMNVMTLNNTINTNFMTLNNTINSNVVTLNNAIDTKTTLNEVRTSDLTYTGNNVYMKLPTAAIQPTQLYELVNKQFVDDKITNVNNTITNINNVVNGKTTLNQVLNNNNDWLGINRFFNTVQCENSPIDNLDLCNKGYVDNRIIPMNKVGGGEVSYPELKSLLGVTGNIQSQINEKTTVEEMTTRENYFGITHFNSSLPTTILYPESNNQLTNKKYVDDAITYSANNNFLDKISFNDIWGANNNFTGNNTFSQCPKTYGNPINGNELCHKLYVDELILNSINDIDNTDLINDISNNFTTQITGLQTQINDIDIVRLVNDINDINLQIDDLQTQIYNNDNSELINDISDNFNNQIIGLQTQINNNDNNELITDISSNFNNKIIGLQTQINTKESSSSTGINANRIGAGLVTNENFQCLASVSWNIQNQFNELYTGVSNRALLTGVQNTFTNINVFNNDISLKKTNINGDLAVSSNSVSISTLGANIQLNSGLIQTNGPIVFNSNLRITTGYSINGVTTDNLSCLWDISSNIQDQLNSKENKTSTGINANRIADGSISNLNFQCLNGISSNIQTQLNNKVGVSDNNILTGSNVFKQDGNLPFIKGTQNNNTGGMVLMVANALEDGYNTSTVAGDSVLCYYKDGVASNNGALNICNWGTDISGNGIRLTSDLINMNSPTIFNQGISPNYISPWTNVLVNSSVSFTHNLNLNLSQTTRPPRIVLLASNTTAATVNTSTNIMYVSPDGQNVGGTTYGFWANSLSTNTFQIRMANALHYFYNFSTSTGTQAVNQCIRVMIYC